MNNTPTIITDEKTEAISLMNENEIMKIEIKDVCDKDYESEAYLEDFNGNKETYYYYMGYGWSKDSTYKENLIERLHKAYELGEFPFEEELEKIFKETDFETCENGEKIHAPLVNAMYDLMVASQMKGWQDFEDTVFRRVQNQLMKYLGLNYDDIKKVRGI